jgi:uncharacterized protein YrrD
MSIIFLSQELNGRPIVSASNGQIIAKVLDILIAPENGPQVAALATSKGSLLKREIEAIPVNEVLVWGQDVILVSGPDVIAREDALPGSQEWLSVSDQVRGREVYSINGTHVGELNDVVMNTQGHLIAYDLAQVSVEGPIAESKRIPIEATQSLGQDVFIVSFASSDQPQYSSRK